MAKTRKGGKGKNKKSGKKRGAPKKRGKPAAKKKLGGGGGGFGGLGGGRPKPPMEIDPGYYIMHQYFDDVEYEVGQILVEENKEHWFMYNLTQPEGTMNGYTYPSDKNTSYQSTNVSTRFEYKGTSTIEAICQAVGDISTYKILDQYNGTCSQ